MYAAVFFRFGDGDPDGIPLTDRSPIQRVECPGVATGRDVQGVCKIDVARCQIKGESHLLGLRSIRVVPRQTHQLLLHQLIVSEGWA